MVSQQFLNLVDGKSIPAASGKTIPISNPATGVVWATIPDSSEEDARRAVAAASNAFDQWARMSGMQRTAILRQVGRVLAENIEELSALESRDSGRLLHLVKTGDMPGAAFVWDEAASQVRAASVGSSLQVDDRTFAFTRREPLGVVVGIAPWNAPLPTMTAKSAWALAAGNCVVIKPAEQACTSVLRFAELIADVLPPGVLNVVAGIGEVVGDALVRDPAVAKVSLTGSSKTGKVVAQIGADTLKRFSLELGGKSPNIVFADANLEQAARGVSTTSIFTDNAGQGCICGSRILVQESVFDEVLDRVRSIVDGIVLGDPADSGTTMGPLVSSEQFETVTHYIRVGIDEGCTVLFGGRSGAELFEASSPLRHGYFVEPTLLLSPDNRIRVCQEEIFGPVATIMSFESEDEAIALANDSSYGLAAGVWTNDIGRMQRVTRRLDVGTVWVNTYRRYVGGMPFAGTKASGYGEDSLLENTRLKTCIAEYEN